MNSFKDWIEDAAEELEPKFATKYDARIKEEWNTKFKDSYPSYEDFIENEMGYVTDTLLNDEWCTFVSEKHTEYIGDQIDHDYEVLKDAQYDNS